MISKAQFIKSNGLTQAVDKWAADDAKKAATNRKPETNVGKV
jgi:hypothetical protein